MRDTGHKIAGKGRGGVLLVGWVKSSEHSCLPDNYGNLLRKCGLCVTKRNWKWLLGGGIVVGEIGCWLNREAAVITWNNNCQR